MKAVRLVKPGQPLQLVEIDRPSPGPGDVLVRVRAAGICHSDAHYRAGTVSAGPLPLTPGHEIAGTVQALGASVRHLSVGQRICVHYLVTCGECAECKGGHEQFCASGKMHGKDRDGGYAEFVLTSARSVFPLPDEVPFEWGALLMCSSATSLHALRKARFQPGESVCVFGAGGLGLSAVQLARALGAGAVHAVDIHPERLELAERLGARGLDASRHDPVSELRRRTGGRGVDVALELIGSPRTMRQAVQVLAFRGRAALAGITDQQLELDSYSELLCREAEVIGVSDHLASEIPELIRLAAERRLDLSKVVTAGLPLDAPAINQTLDRLEQFGGGVRGVILPQGPSNSSNNE